jgi:membrane protein implicated in regulation of membrane protease activity
MFILTEPVYWALAAGLLMLAELIIPGGIVFFLGGGCLVVALALWSGVVTTWSAAMTLFFISSLLLIFGLRALFSQFVEGDSTTANTVEILDEVDRVVLVVERIGPGRAPGLVSFQGTRWRALGDGSEMLPDSHARVVARENTTIIVAPCLDKEGLDKEGLDKEGSNKSLSD